MSNSCLLSSSLWPGRWRLSLTYLPSCVCTQAKLSLSPAQLSCVHDWFHLCWCNVMNSATKSKRNGSTSHIEERNVRVTIDWCDRLSTTAGSGTIVPTLSRSSLTRGSLWLTRLCVLGLSHFLIQVFLPLCTVPTRLLCSWGSPGKNTGVGSHSLL